MSVSLTIRADKHAHSLTPVIKGEPETAGHVLCVFVGNVNASHEELMSPVETVAGGNETDLVNIFHIQLSWLLFKVLSEVSNVTDTNSKVSFLQFTVTEGSELQIV